VGRPLSNYTRGGAWWFPRDGLFLLDKDDLSVAQRSDHEPLATRSRSHALTESYCQC